MKEIKNPFLFKKSKEVEDYIKSLSIEELMSFRNLIATKKNTFKKLESIVSRFIRMYVLMASHEDLKMNYLKLLDLTNKYGHRIYNLIDDESHNNEITITINETLPLEELQKVTLKEFYDLYDLENISNPLSSTIANKLKTVSNVMINYTNSCNKQVFGEAIDKDIEVIDLPVCIIGKKINGEWDYKACIERLNNQLHFNLNIK